ncbi:AlbA family DNA-binding domain-containing protein [Sphingobacterium paucimobilis]|uniref:Schlafen AlbA-2 domain-containing protein n=1 Tax=Sphingobacterium paucimobilis HER1398 TaxID=1346330 RepID=U2IWU5_9SPHI|nr:ATP-binding protein [Sphingobacterium paucimobilis]ERJ57149.1 hypothetical protein M472_00070 [Sphingobacterium paucimobilis HER1398]
MSYSERIFGKNLRDLSFDDISTYFQEPREESEILEFKSGHGDFEGVFVNNILRTINAFLNSSGGLLIWGAPKDIVIENGKPKVCVGDLIPLTILKEKDHLINRISSSISYMPIGIRAERLEKDGQYLYVFEVDESASKPHQYNGLYHIRLDGQSKPAPHYIVDALFKQVKFADLECKIDFKLIKKLDEDTVIEFNVNIWNRSKYIIEKSLSVTAFTTMGYFDYSKNDTLNLNQSTPFHYGPPRSFNNQIVFKQIDLFNSTTCKIYLMFGGENSMAKTSQYELDLKPLADGNFDLEPNLLVKESKENTLID